VEVNGGSEGLTRRGVISRAAALGAGTGIVGALSGPAALANAARRAEAHAPHPGTAEETVAFYGPQQAGIATSAPDYLCFAAFDLTATAGHELRELLESWTAAAVSLTAGGVYEPTAQSLAEPPSDTGEARGRGPARLTMTFGFGPSLFAGERARRLGIAGSRPQELRELPAFAHERIERTSSGGDICVQACAEDPQVAFHAVHELARVAAGKARPRWSQQGFGRTSSTSRTQSTPRNLLGFKDGTENLRSEDTSLLEQFVWVAPGEGPRWMAGGTYLVARRIRMLFDRWDATSLEQQQRTIGREKLTGAPLGERAEFDTLDLQARGPSGEPQIPLDAHVRLASPQSNDGAAILRRGYSYGEGIDAATGEIDAGLFFISFQRSPSRQFVPLQRRLSRSDALNRFTVHTSSSVFACPPGTLPGGFIGELLFA